MRGTVIGLASLFGGCALVWLVCRVPAVVRHVCRRFVWLRTNYSGGPIIGCGFEGTEANNECFLYAGFDTRQIYWRLASTKYTRAFVGGIGLGPARFWLNVEADRRGCYCATLHVCLPGSGHRCGPVLWPYGQVRAALYPQNNEVGTP